MYYLLGLLVLMAIVIAWLIYKLFWYRHALRKVIYDGHHLGANPKAKTIRGLTGLGLLETTPGTEAHQYFLLIEAEAQKLETDVLKTIREFEGMI